VPTAAPTCPVPTAAPSVVTAPTCPVPTTPVGH
jgi:hypothetical protein